VVATKLKGMKAPVLSFLNEKQLERLDACMVSITKNDGQPIILAKDEVKGLYLIAEGEVGIFVDAVSSGPTAKLGGGEHFGEASLIDQTNIASSTIRALHNRTELLLINKKAATQIFESDPTMAIALYKGISASLRTRLKNMNNRLKNFVGQKKIALVKGFDAKEILDGTSAAIKEGKTSGKNIKSIRVGIDFALEELATRFPAGIDTINAIRDDLKNVEEIEEAWFVALEKQSQQTSNFLKQLDDLLAAS
jgi:CRP-like cAMP-binding protein